MPNITKFVRRFVFFSAFLMVVIIFRMKAGVGGGGVGVYNFSK